MLGLSLNKKSIDNSLLLDKALESFKDSTGFDFLDVLTDESSNRKFIEKNNNKDFTDYIEERKEILEEIQEIEFSILK